MKEENNEGRRLETQRKTKKKKEMSVNEALVPKWRLMKKESM